MDLLDTKYVDQAIKEALTERRRFTAASAEAIKQYVGKSYRVGFGADNFENFPYQYVTTVAPQLAMYAPTCSVTEGGYVSEETDALEDGLKSWMRQSKLARTLIACAHDVLFDFSCTLTDIVPTPGWKGQPGESVPVPMWPQVTRVSPRAVFRDPRAVEFGRSRYDGHLAIVERSSLLRAVDKYGVPRYDPEALANLTGCTDLDEIRKDLMTDGVCSFDTDKSVLLYCLKDNETGMIATYAAGGKEGLTLIRKPIKSDRHYTFYGVGLVPDQLYPLSPLAVTAQQVEEINQQRRYMSKAAGAHKEITVANGTDTGLVENVMNAPHGGVLQVAGFNGSLNKIVLGGVLPGTYEYLEFSRNKLQELAGMNDIERGNFEGADTAAEVNEAAAGADSRRTFMRNLFKDGVREMLEGVVNLMDQTETVRFPVTRMNQEGAWVKGEFFGGRDTQDDGYPWERSLTIEIEPNSMEHVNRVSQQVAMQVAQQAVLEIVTAGVQMPWVKVRQMIDDRLQSINIPHGADRWVDVEYMMHAVMAQQQMAALTQATEIAGNAQGKGAKT